MQKTLAILAIAAIVGVGSLGVVEVASRVSGLWDRDRAAVREYLKQHNSSGKWEELRWWPAAEGRHVRAIRLRYRTDSWFGGPWVADEIFVFNDERTKIERTTSIYRLEPELQRHLAD